MNKFSFVWFLRKEQKKGIENFKVGFFCNKKLLKKGKDFSILVFLQVLQMLKLAELRPQRPRNIGITQVPEIGSIRKRRRKAGTKKGKSEEENRTDE